MAYQNQLLALEQLSLAATANQFDLMVLLT